MGWRGGKEKTPQKATNVALASKKRLKDVVDALLWRARALIKTVVELLLVQRCKKKKKKKKKDIHQIYNVI